MFCNDLIENPICKLGQKIFDATAVQLQKSGSSLRLGILDSFRNEVQIH